MIKAVIFDMDGLLIDSEGVSYTVLRRMLTPYGHTLSEREYTQNYSGRTDQNNIATLITRFALPFGEAEGLARLMEMDEQLLAQGVPLKPGAKELLGYLSANGYRTALATSSRRARAMPILQHHGITASFDVFVFEDEIAASKPAPDVFQKACQKLGLPPQDCLVLEDSEAGIAAAHAAGATVLCVPDRKAPGPQYQAMAAATLRDLHGVIPYLQKAAIAK